MEATSSVPELRAVQQQQLHHPIVAQRVDTSTAHEDATRLIVHTSTFAAISTAKIRSVTITLTVQRERIIGVATHQPIGSRHHPFPLLVVVAHHRTHATELLLRAVIVARCRSTCPRRMGQTSNDRCRACMLTHHARPQNLHSSRRSNSAPRGWWRKNGGRN